MTKDMCSCFECMADRENRDGGYEPPTSDEAQVALLREFFTDGEYVIYDDSMPRGMTIMLANRRFHHPVIAGTVTIGDLEIHSAERLSDHAVIEWQEDSQTWSVY